MDYWNSTSKITKTGRPVDAVICAVAPYAAPVAGKYDYYGMTPSLFLPLFGPKLIYPAEADDDDSGMSVWANVLDYSASVFPVTTVDKNVDVSPPGYESLSEIDKKVHDSCKYFSPW